MPPDEVRLRVRDLGKVRGDSGHRVHIEVPELSLAAGELVAVLGANGSGKSTPLDILGLILAPDRAAELALSGADPPLDLRRLSNRQKIAIRRRYFGYVLQTGGLLEFLTLRGNIRLAARLARRPPAAVEETARLLGITDVLDKRPGRVSGGQRQKAAIARALVQQPAIILADEPTAAMDRPSARALLQTFARLTTEAHSSVLMVTHDYDLVREAAHRFYHFRIEPQGEGLLRAVLLPGLPAST